MGTNGKTAHMQEMVAPQPSTMRRKKMKKFFPALMWAGLSYATFCDKSSHIGMPVKAAETLNNVNGGVKAGRNGRRDHDLVILDDSNNEEVYGFDNPNDLTIGGSLNDNENFANNDHTLQDSSGPGVIVVATVDGTLAGISKETGRVLWKQSEDVARTSSTSSSSLMKQHTNSNPGMKKNRGDTSQILKPLVSTTTTTKSATDAAYKAVPSVDGTIFTTTNEISMTTSVKDIVARSPFLDPRGKFYMGTRYATAAALDGETGQVLRVVSSSTRDIASEDASSLPDLEGRNIIWIGRVDHEVSVQDAKTGMIDAQFSVAEVMSVADMQGLMGTEIWKPEPVLDGSRSSITQNAMTTGPKENIDPDSTIVATPNGNIAMWNFEDGRFSWVANEAFDSPIAYAMDASTGLVLGVDIIPDATDPSASIADLTKEMERQSEMASLGDTPVIGAMPNGQLYALPLRRKRSSSMVKKKSASSIAGTASSGSANSKPHTVSQLPGRTTVKLHPNDNPQQQHPPHFNHKPNDPEYNIGGKTGSLVVKKPCISTLPTYPACLVEKGNILSDRPPAIASGSQQAEEGSLVVANSNYYQEEGGFIHPVYGRVSPIDFGGFNHPEYGWVTPRDLFGNKRSDQNTFRRVLGSWLPPTIALIFVLSFELGRRKRLKDEKKDYFLTPEQMDKMNSHDVKFSEDVREAKKEKPQEVISVSEEVLGYGGHGTVVYKGVLDGRNVAVKRMLKAYHASADREISLLIESDGDPNVVRYFLKEVRGDFVYLALELCDLSLHELIGVLREKQQERGFSNLLNANEAADVISSESMNATLRILFQIASGVKHLHSLRIVHRDLKPANILLALSKSGKKKVKDDDPIFNTFVHDYYDAKISDMGLGKQLIGQSSIGASFIGESSFRGNKSGTPSVGVGPGTVGWQAPEVMALRLSSDTSARSMDSSKANGESRDYNDPPQGIRTSRSVDIFSLGCIFYSILIPGYHPFGEWFEREANIMHNRPNLDPLKKISSEAYHLIRSMLSRNPKLRPTAKEVCQHPFFWDSQKKLVFLCDFSDRLETDLITQSSTNVFNSLAIERGAADVVGTSWEPKLDIALVDNVQKFRTYDYSCVRDLLRLIRNKHHHFEELPEAFRLSTAPTQVVLFEYFAAKFPALTMHCYSFCGKNLAEDDPLMSKFNISQAKVDTNEIAAAPTSVTLKKKKSIASDTNVLKPIDPICSVVTQEETKSDTGDDVTAEVVTDDEEEHELDEGIIIWEGSIAAKTYNCRGWHRSQDEWSRHIEPFYKKREPALKRCLEDPKFRTRLCNHWDTNLGAFCPMKKKNKCIFAHGPAELRVKEGKKNRWGKLVDKNGNNSNPWHSGGEDTYGAASSIEKVRKEEGKWNANKTPKKNNGPPSARKKKNGATPNRKQAPKTPSN